MFYQKNKRDLLLELPSNIIEMAEMKKEQFDESVNRALYQASRNIVELEQKQTKERKSHDYASCSGPSTTRIFMQNATISREIVRIISSNKLNPSVTYACRGLLCA